MDTENKIVQLVPTQKAKNDEPTRSAFDAARETLDSFEKMYAGQPVPRILLVFDGPSTAFGHAGAASRPSEAAGLLFAAAQMVLTHPVERV